MATDRAAETAASVLLVDDVGDVRRVVRTALRLRGGFTVVGEAATGVEAVRVAEELQPDLVVLDLQLPDITGRDVLTRIRECAPATKIVIFSGMDPADGDWFARNAEGYVVKDADISFLVELLESLVRPQLAEYRLELAAEPESSSRARRFLVESLGEELTPELYDDAAIVVSELVTNAVTHAGSACVLELALSPTALRMAVADTGPGTPEPQPRSDEREHGRGLQLVGAIASAWGIDSDDRGKVVWAELARPQGHGGPGHAGATAPLSRGVGSATATSRQRARSTDPRRRVGERRLQSLADASRAIAGAPGVDGVLAAVTESARLIIGTHHALAARLYDGSWENAVTSLSLSDTYADLDRGGAPRSLPESREVLAEVTRHNRPVRVDAGERGTYLAAPFTSRDGGNIGLIQLSHKIDETAFDAGDEAVCVQLALMVSAALEHVELASELEEALVGLQRPLRPPALPAIPGLDLGSVFEPFSGDRGLAGDFYDAFSVGDGRWLLALGDVSGKGPEAAAVTGLVRHTLWASAQHTTDPVAIAADVNAALLRDGSDRFATLVLALVEPGPDSASVEAVWAGHQPGLLVGGAVARSVSGRGIPLGLFDVVDLEVVRFELAADETLLLYTDGLIERGDAVVPEERVGALLTELLDEEADLSVEGVLVRLSGALARHQQRDDIALLAVRN